MNLVLINKDEVISMLDAQDSDAKDRAKERVKSWLSLRLPEPAINIGLIKMIKDLPDYTNYTVKGKELLNICSIKG